MSKTIYKINDKPSGTPYDDAPLKARVTALENKPDNDKQTLTFTEGNRNLSISNGNTVTLPDYLKKDDAYTLSGANFFVAKGDIPGKGATIINKNTVYNADTIKVGDTVRDRFLERASGILEYGYWKVTAVTDTTVTVEPLGTERDITIGQPNQSLTLRDRELTISGGNSVTLPNDRQTLTLSGNSLSISNGNSVNLPQYVSLQDFNNLKNEYNQLKGAFTALLQNLKNSGAWNQTGGNIFEGSLRPDRNIATGNINLFGGTVDGNAFIRTNNGKTENDLAGGIN